MTVAQSANLVLEESVSHIGMSMGARYGLPMAAALGTRLGAVVIGNFGLQQTPLIDARLHRVDAIRQAAQAIVAPTPMHVQWDDDVFPRDGQLVLFDILGARDKRLLAYPGPHSSTPLRAERDWTEFVITCLSERGQRLSLSRRAQP